LTDNSLDDFSEHPLYFKHVYGRGVHEWGVVGFPTTQPASRAAKRYEPGGAVLLAIPLDPDVIDGEVAPGELRGKVFGVCTLASIARTETRVIANPEMVRLHPEDVKRWPTALPVLKLWHFEEPHAYAHIGEGALADLARRRRGHLIAVRDPDLVAELREWLRRAPRKEETITHSDKVRDYLKRWTQG
jgi:hypothetical protein